MAVIERAFRSRKQPVHPYPSKSLCGHGLAMVQFMLPCIYLALSGTFAGWDWGCVRRVPAATHAHGYSRPATTAAAAATTSPRITSIT